MNYLKILIADDHSILRNGIANLLRNEFRNVEIVEVDNGLDVIEKTRQDKWDLILLDITMPGINGLDALKQIRVSGVKAPVLIISMQPENLYAMRALKAGASGYFNKMSLNSEFIVAIRKVLEGKKYLTESVREIIALGIDNNDRATHESLSDREMEILILIAKGKSNSVICKELFLSSSTVSTYKAKILEKLNLSNNAELTRYALDNQLL